MSEYNHNEINKDIYEAKPEQYSIYPKPQFLQQEVKPRKKKWFSRLIKFTVAAVAFGMIAGAASIGVQYLTNPQSTEEIELEDNNLEIPLTYTSADKENMEPTVIPTNTDMKGIVSDVSDIVDKVMPSIVAINSSATLTSYDFFGRKFNEPVEGSGSGIIIGQSDTELLIVTNNHVITGADTVEIVFSNESTAKAEVKGAEANVDLAVLEVKLDDLSEETLKTIKVARLGDSTQLKAGEMAIAIGNALGYGQSVTVGYISATDREINIGGVNRKLIQTDAAINPGNSGGALISTTGEVIGINSVKYASRNVEGMGYAIPITDAIPMINQLMNRVVLSASEKGYLGINLETAQEITNDFSQQFHMPIGIYIKDVIENTPAEKAGLRQGNIIVAVNDIKVETKQDLINILSYTQVNEEVTIKVKELKQGEYVEKELTAILGKRP